MYTMMRMFSGLLAIMILFGCFSGRVYAENQSTKVGVLSISTEAPAGIALDGQETLFVVLSTSARVAVIENSGERIAEIVGFQQPVSIAVDENIGRLYVGDAGTGSVLVFGPDLAFLGRLGIGPGEFVRPVGIAVDGTGSVYVVDGDREKVRVYGADRMFRFEFGQTGSNPGQIRHPVSIAVDRGTNEIIIVDRPIIKGTTGNFEGSRVQIFGPTGIFLRGFGQYGNGEGKLSKATGVASDHAGRIYVADAELHVVPVFDRTGIYVETIYDAAAVMATPVGIAVGGTSGRVFVSSISGNRVNVYGVNAQHVVSAESSAGGTITPAGRITVVHGAGVSFVAQPDPGFHVEAVLVDGADIGAGNEFSLPVVMADQNVFVQFCKDFHTVLVEGSTGGEVTPSGAVSVQHKTDLTIVITPDPGWRIAEVLADGKSLRAVESYTLSSVTEDHAVSVSFARIAYIIQATAEPGGSISPSGSLTVFQGTSATFLITSEIGYRIAGLLVDNVPVTAADSYTFTTIMASHEIRALFEREVIEISASASAGGSITPAGVVKVLYGDSLAFSTFSGPGNYLSEVYVDNRPIGATGQYEFIAVTEPHTIRAEFARNRYTITAVGQGNGTVNPAGTVSALYGDSWTFSLTPLAGHHVARIVVDGQDVETGTALTFNNINADHALTVFFAENNDLPVALAGPDQIVVQGTVVLNGEHSFDKDGAIVSCLWEQLSGPPVTLLDPGSAKASFDLPESGEQGNSLLFRLTVTDNKGATATDDCLISITDDNRPPVAKAGLDQTVAPGATVVLDGSNSVDVDGVVSSWSWRQISGKPVQLTSADNAQASFVAPVADSALAFRLQVTDESGLMAKDDCLINVTVTQVPPVAEAGVNLIVREGETVVLDGLNSFDVDNGIRSYLWKQVLGTPAVSLINHRTAQASFIAPQVTNDGTMFTFELLVTDQSGLVAADILTVLVNKTLPGRNNIGSVVLSKKSKGKLVSVAIELPAWLHYETIRTDTVAVTRINGLAIAPPLTRTGPLEIVDSNGNGILELMVKFDRESLIGLLGSGTSVVIVSGSLQDGTEFQQEFRMIVNE